MAARKKASGKNIPEAQRKTVAVKLRLAPDVAAELDALAGDRGLTRSATVTALVDAAWSSAGLTLRGLLVALLLAGCASSPDGEVRRCDSNDDCRDLFNVRSRCEPRDGVGICTRACESTEECRREVGPTYACEDGACVNH